MYQIGKEYYIRKILDRSGFWPYRDYLEGCRVILINSETNIVTGRPLVTLKFVSKPSAPDTETIFHRMLRDNEYLLGKDTFSITDPTLELVEDNPIPYDEEDQVED